MTFFNHLSLSMAIFLHLFSWPHLYSNHLEHDTGVGYSSNFEFLMVVSFAVVYVVCLFVYFVLLGSDILLLFIFYFTYATWNFFFCPSLSFFFKFVFTKWIIGLLISNLLVSLIWELNTVHSYELEAWLLAINFSMHFHLQYI